MYLMHMSGNLYYHIDRINDGMYVLSGDTLSSIMDNSILTVVDHMRVNASSM